MNPHEIDTEFPLDLTKVVNMSEKPSTPVSRLGKIRKLLGALSSKFI